MWTKSMDNRSEILLPGTNFVGNNLDDRIKDYMSWPGGHLLYFLPDRNRGLMLYTNFYKRQEASILISSNPEHWDGTAVDCDGGVIYVMTPFLQSYVGPISLASYIAHKIEPNYIEEDLAHLEERMEVNKEVPPFEI